MDEEDLAELRENQKLVDTTEEMDSEGLHLPLRTVANTSEFLAQPMRTLTQAASLSCS